MYDRLKLIATCLFLTLPCCAWAEGHGPSFALATPTLGTGGWSIDTVAMHTRTSRGSMTALGTMFGYGIFEDLQVNLKLPVASGNMMRAPNLRAGMMGAPRDVEAQLLWRFHRHAPAIGTRRETTLHLSAAYPTADRRGMRPGASLNAAVATGYASLSHYGWLAAGYQIFDSRGGDRLGDLPYLTAAYGYRPGLFQQDGTPDWRFFIEAVAEFPGKDQLDGQRQIDTGGRRVLAGPTFLALGGPWGLSGGVLFPVFDDLRDTEPEERLRAKLIVTYWF